MKLIKHACRTLIKQGHQPTLKMLGYTPLKLGEVKLILENNVVKYGKQLTFEFIFSGAKDQSIIIDYAIHFKKSNGTKTPKVFKWKIGKINNKGEFKASKNHTIKPITTRKYYNGDHDLEIFVNGKSIIKVPFTLTGVN
jgi:hypothetical protein